MEQKLELYIMPTCPYCRKVLLYMDQNGIDLPLRDITVDPGSRDFLKREGGKVQVPCLFIDGKPLYESDDIITYLAEAFDGADGGVIDEEARERLDDGAACPLL